MSINMCNGNEKLVKRKINNKSTAMMNAKYGISILPSIY